MNDERPTSRNMVVHELAAPQTLLSIVLIVVGVALVAAGVAAGWVVAALGGLVMPLGLSKWTINALARRRGDSPTR
jgi:1,4-dihydroxy-2-naphthoate octaprenyltransferase